MENIYLRITMYVGFLENLDLIYLLTQIFKLNTTGCMCLSRINKIYRRKLVLCLNVLLGQLNGLYEPFVEEILRRNPSNSGETQTGNAVGNPERSLLKGTCNDQSYRRRAKRFETGETLIGF